MLVKHISTQHNRPTALLNMHVSLWRFLSVLKFSSQSEWSTIKFLIICRGLQTSGPYFILFSIIIVGQKAQTLFVSAILNTSLLSRWHIGLCSSQSAVRLGLFEITFIVLHRSVYSPNIELLLSAIESENTKIHTLFKKTLRTLFKKKAYS